MPSQQFRDQSALKLWNVLQMFSRVIFFIEESLGGIFYVINAL
jgi:hypothetical protein